MNTLAKILTPKNLNNSLVLVGSFLLFGLLFLLSWASYRGFDFSDESYYHIGCLFHSEIDNPVIFFHRIYVDDKLLQKIRKSEILASTRSIASKLRGCLKNMIFS